MSLLQLSNIAANTSYSRGLFWQISILLLQENSRLIFNKNIIIVNVLASSFPRNCRIGVSFKWKFSILHYAANVHLYINCASASPSADFLISIRQSCCVFFNLPLPYFLRAATSSIGSLRCQKYVRLVLIINNNRYYNNMNFIVT